MIEYISELQMSRGEIRAGLANGVLSAWRADCDGVQWFRRVGVIRAVPPGNTDAASANDDDDDLDFDDEY